MAILRPHLEYRKLVAFSSLSSSLSPSGINTEHSFTMSSRRREKDSTGSGMCVLEQMHQQIGSKKVMHEIARLLAPT